MNVKIMSRKRLIFILFFGMLACGQPENQGRGRSFSDPAEIVVVPGNFDTLINQARHARGMPALQSSPQLTRAAQSHANDMSQVGFFSHKGSNGQSIGSRVAATAYGHCWASENISWNRASEAEVFARWMASPRHRKNMLSREPTEYGLAVAPGNYRVLVLARPGC